jgi:hypothetical protein
MNTRVMRELFQFSESRARDRGDERGGDATKQTSDDGRRRLENEKHAKKNEQR